VHHKTKRPISATISADKLSLVPSVQRQAKVSNNPHFYMFLTPSKHSGSQLLRFETLFYKTLGYHHQLAPLNSVSKLLFSLID